MTATLSPQREASSPASADGKTVRRITVKDVAARAGVAHATVCVVLNGAKGATRVSEATRSRILEAPADLGYRRNGNAGNMKAGCSGWISLLLAAHEPLSALNDNLMMGASQELMKHNLHLHLESVAVGELYQEELWPKALREWMPDGLIISYAKRAVPELKALIQRHHIPAVWTNARHEYDCIYPFLAALKGQTSRQTETISATRLYRGSGHAIESN